MPCASEIRRRGRRKRREGGERRNVCRKKQGKVGRRRRKNLDGGERKLSATKARKNSISAVSYERQ